MILKYIYGLVLIVLWIIYIHPYIYNSLQSSVPLLTSKNIIILNQNNIWV